MGVYAVGLNKSWVEIRSGAKPKTERTRAIRIAELPPGFQGNSTSKAVRHQFVLESVIHVGGKVVATMTRPAYLALMRKLGETPVETSAVRMLGPLLGKHFLSESWRRDNHV